jgi:hypothetical protein
LIPFASTGLESLIHDYGLYRAAVETRSWNWHEGMRRDTDVMVFKNAPVGRICHGGGVPPGNFVLGANTPWWGRAIMLFFDKRAIEIRPPPPGR